jgi:hypothetical protein
MSGAIRRAGTLPCRCRGDGAPIIVTDQKERLQRPPEGFAAQTAAELLQNQLDLRPNQIVDRSATRPRHWSIAAQLDDLLPGLRKSLPGLFEMVRGYPRQWLANVVSANTHTSGQRCPTLSS